MANCFTLINCSMCLQFLNMLVSDVKLSHLDQLVNLLILVTWQTLQTLTGKPVMFQSQASKQKTYIYLTVYYVNSTILK